MIVIDTHVLIWYATAREILSAAAMDTIEGTDVIGVSAITPWEIAVKVAAGRYDIVGDMRSWMDSALSFPRVRLLPLLPEISIRSAELRSKVGNDPADCVIVATSLHFNAPLVTRDRAIHRSGVTSCIW